MLPLEFPRFGRLLYKINNRKVSNRKSEIHYRCSQGENLLKENFVHTYTYQIIPNKVI